MRPHLIFDGDCGFCTTSATWFAERLNHDETDPVVAAWQHLDLEALGVEGERCAREVVWVSADGTQAGGAQAFASWLRHRRGPRRMLGSVLTLPLVRQLAGIVYTLIARNRYRLPGGTPACALPPQQRPGQS